MTVSTVYVGYYVPMMQTLLVRAGAALTKAQIEPSGNSCLITSRPR